MIGTSAMKKLNDEVKYFSRSLWRKPAFQNCFSREVHYFRWFGVTAETGLNKAMGGRWSWSNLIFSYMERQEHQNSRILIICNKKIMQIFHFSNRVEMLFDNDILKTHFCCSLEFYHINFFKCSVENS